MKTSWIFNLVLTLGSAAALGAEQPVVPAKPPGGPTPGNVTVQPAPVSPPAVSAPNAPVAVPAPNAPTAVPAPTSPTAETLSGGGGGGYVSGGGRGSMVRLITFPEVQDELALTPAQREAVKDLAQRVSDYEAQFFAEIANPPPPQMGPGVRAQFFSTRYDGANRMLAGARQEVARTLSPAQMSRLDQIGLQDLGPEAVYRPDIARALALTPAQQQALSRMRMSAIAAARPPMPVPSVARPLSAPTVPRTEVPTPPALRGGGATGRAAGGAGATAPVPSPELDRRSPLEILSPQQRSKLQELQGRPLHIAPRPAGSASVGASSSASAGVPQ